MVMPAEDVLWGDANLTDTKLENGSDVNVFNIVCRGYLQPVLALFTTFTNVLAICVFSKKNKSPTTLLISAMCITDILTGLSSVPHNVYIYGFGRGHQAMPRELCRVEFLMMIILRNIFHTASTMFTVILCFERFICVCYPFIARRWCSLRKIVMMMAITVVLGVMLHGHLLGFVKCSLKGHDCECPYDGPIGWKLAYYILRILYCHLTPCVLVAVLTVKLFLAIRHNQKSVSKYQVSAVSRRISITRDRMTNMSIAVALIFVLTEVPVAVLYVLWVIEKSTHWDLSEEMELNFKSILDVLIAVNCMCNFWIFCCMSANFRNTLVKLFTCVKTGTEENIASGNGTSNSSEVNTKLFNYS